MVLLLCKLMEQHIALKLLLDSSVPNTIHNEKILACDTLKDAHIYCKLNNLSGQFTGPVLENIYKKNII